ncbi:MAG: peptidoglycan DD-metalloendopeptidase family protein [Hyphomicrobiaceae bacterium]|nr:peptidoglycan DD-metalloendopeptidase family protein [Hyphomicrobiaceae bacterium]
MPKPKSLLAAAVLASALAGCWALPIMAQEQSSPAGEAPGDAVHTEDAAPTAANEATQDAEAELEKINQAITISQDRADFLRQEIENMQGDRDQQNAALIAAAQRVKLAEIEVGDAEARLTGLLQNESDIRARLDGADMDLASLLSALQRIGRNPPPALIIDPADAINAARSASLLSAVLPQLHDRAEKVTADLRALVDVRESVETEKKTLSDRLITLQEEQLRIATLIEARRVGVSRASTELADEEQTAAGLASEATSLDQLITALRQRIAAVDQAVEAAQNASSTEVASLDPDQVAAAFADAGRTAPAISIASARGYLTAPAAGVTITEFGADDGFGGISKGVSILTRADAQVVAPADGWVIYKGPYLNYGQIVILNPGDNFVILLAGLEKLDVDLGQFVRVGEPVGTMGEHTRGATVATNAGNARPTLYIEFRNNNVPFDPAQWWSPVRIAQTTG